MDELATALKIDPVELRLRNYAERDPRRDVPWSSKRLRECYQVGAERFGWDQSPAPTPRSMRDGSDLIGWGMATAMNPAPRYPAPGVRDAACGREMWWFKAPPAIWGREPTPR